MSAVNISSANFSMEVMNSGRPALVVMKRGAIVDRAMGARPKSRILALL